MTCWTIWRRRWQTPTARDWRHPRWGSCAGSVVTRPNRVRVRAQDRDGDWFEAEAEGLTARAFCHEIEHLDGHLFVEHIDHLMTEEELEEYMNRQEEDEE